MANETNNIPVASGIRFSSILQVLLVEKTLTKKLNPETGKPYEIPYGRCVLLDQDGAVVTVGRLKIPRELESQVKVGTFNADFALRVPDYGDDKGDIVAQLTALRAIAPNAFKAVAVAPVAAKV